MKSLPYAFEQVKTDDVGRRGFGGWSGLIDSGRSAPPNPGRFLTARQLAESAGRGLQAAWVPIQPLKLRYHAHSRHAGFRPGGAGLEGVAMKRSGILT